MDQTKPPVIDAQFTVLKGPPPVHQKNRLERFIAWTGAHPSWLIATLMGLLALLRAAPTPPT